MIRSRRLKSVSVVANLALCLVLAFSFVPLGLASQPDNGDEIQVYLPLMLRRPVPFIESTGILDPSFDGDGIVTTVDFGSAGSIDEGFSDVALQSDGKVVGAGSVSLAFETLFDFAVARYNLDGSLDTSFSGDGKVVTDFSHRNDRAQAIRIQRDGKIVVAGFSVDEFGSTTDDFALVRYNPDGNLDPSFDSDGRVLTDIAISDDYATAMVLQPDGKIVVAGYSLGSTVDFSLARYLSDGSLDPDFDSDGKIVTDITGYDEWASAIALQPDGKIIVVGYAMGTTCDFAVVRYNSDGSLDPTFSVDGKLVTDVTGGADFGTDVVLQDDGKIIISGKASNDFALLRYNQNGDLDPTFGDNGKVLTDFAGGQDSGNAVALQPGGQIVLAGQAWGTTYDFALARYNPDGSLDISFGSGGKVLTDIAGGSDQCRAMVLQLDGRIVVLGLAASVSDAFFVAVRYK